VGNNSGEVWCVRFPNAEILGVFSGVHAAPLTCGQFSMDGKCVVSGSEDGTFVVWDIEKHSPVRTWTDKNGKLFQEEAITAVGIYPKLGSPLCLVGGSEGSVTMVNLNSGAVWFTLLMGWGFLSGVLTIAM
jgi:ribosome assembly protein SQT1